MSKDDETVAEQIQTAAAGATAAEEIAATDGWKNLDNRRVFETEKVNGYSEKEKKEQ